MCRDYMFAPMSPANKALFISVLYLDVSFQALELRPGQMQELNVPVDGNTHILPSYYSYY